MLQVGEHITGPLSWSFRLWTLIFAERLPRNISEFLDGSGLAGISWLFLLEQMRC